MDPSAISPQLQYLSDLMKVFNLQRPTLQIVLWRRQVAVEANLRLDTASHLQLLRQQRWFLPKIRSNKRYGFFIKAFEIRLPGHREKSPFYSCLDLVMASFRVMRRSFLLTIACAFHSSSIEYDFRSCSSDFLGGKELLFTFSNQNNSHHLTSILL